MFKYTYACFPHLNLKPIIEVFSYKALKEDHFTFEPCELGKNLNLKYKEVIEKFEKVENSKLEDFYCINYKCSNVTLYSHPSLTYENVTYFGIRMTAICSYNLLKFILITENDFIDHTNKDNPIVPYYQKNEYTEYDNSETYLEYNYQYIKYETDNGFIFNDKIVFNGIGAYGSNSFDRENKFDYILLIKFRMNRANYDFYRRTFIKFQSFLADVMSLINLLIAISKIISEFLLYKKMHKDIIKYIITNNDLKENKIEKQIFQNKLKLKKVFNIDDSKLEKFDKKIDQNQIIEEKVNSKVSLETSNKDCLLEFEEEDKNRIKAEKLKFY